MFISVRYMFRAAMCQSSGELIVSIRHLVYVTLYRRPSGVQVWMCLIQTCTPNGHLYRVTYTRCRIDTINPLKPELNPICYLLALLGAHHFLHVSRIRVKSLTFRLLMSYIYMEHPFLMFLDHTQRRSTVGRTPLDE